VPMQTGGTKRHMGVPWTTSHPDALVYGPPPDLGGDTRAVLREVLGRDDAEIAAIERRLEGS
jgi:crotonobetainyl-CoA:carnitine CoA-transferase CaiB-like acyl-CoA transferase